MKNRLIATGFQDCVDVIYEKLIVFDRKSGSILKVTQFTKEVLNTSTTLSEQVQNSCKVL